MWHNLIYTGLCRLTKFMYGINDSVHTTLSSKISVLVFNVNTIFKVFVFCTVCENATEFYFPIKYT